MPCKCLALNSTCWMNERKMKLRRQEGRKKKKRRHGLNIDLSLTQIFWYYVTVPAGQKEENQGSYSSPYNSLYKTDLIPEFAALQWIPSLVKLSSIKQGSPQRRGHWLLQGHPHHPQNRAQHLKLVPVSPALSPLLPTRLSRNMWGKKVSSPRVTEPKKNTSSYYQAI